VKHLIPTLFHRIAKNEAPAQLGLDSRSLLVFSNYLWNLLK